MNPRPHPWRQRLSTLGALTFLAGAPSCSGNTGSGLLEFQAVARGAPPPGPSGSWEFDNELGYRVTLTQARVFVGGIYLKRTKSLETARPTSCIEPGTYVGQVSSGLSVDALDARPQPFPTLGQAIVDRALTGEVWLTGRTIDADDDSTWVLDARGEAMKDGVRYPFEAQLSIGSNRTMAPKDPALPGASPLCQQRIVGPLGVDFGLAAGGMLVLTIHPDRIFATVDFQQLEVARAFPPLYRFRNRNEGQPDINLMNGLRARTGVYTLTWERTSP